MTAIADEVKEKVKDVKGKVVGTAEKATNTTKKPFLYPLPPLLIVVGKAQRTLLRNMMKKNQCLQLKKQHEPTAVSIDPND
jgi:hypothetical protein